MEPVVLAFHIPGGVQPRLRQLCAEKNITLRLIGREQYGVALGSLVAGSAVTGGNGEEFTEPMLVMALFPKGMMSDFLDSFPGRLIPSISLKAVLTPTNAAWTAERLYRELGTERESFRKYAKK